jgi:protein-disulfide isomerase
MGAGRTKIVLALAAGAALTAVLVAASLVGRDGEADRQPVAAGAEQTTALLDGIPQQGISLGREDAPATLVEFADIQCPPCGQFALSGFSGLVDEYVRPGLLRIELRGLAFIGPDSDRALRAALAAGQQDRLWHVLDLLFHAQGAANSGWVSDELLQSIGAAVPGLDTERMLEEMHGAAVEQRMEEAARAAQEIGVPGTPFFQLGATGGVLQPLQVQSLGVDGFRPALDSLLGR